MSDIYDVGTPKYKSPQSIYDGLCELVQSEEISLLSDIFPDVSWERQGYYYQDNGDRLKEKFEELTDYCNKMWLMEVACWQIDQDMVHDLIFEALINPDFARRIGLKKLFVEHMLRGDESNYKNIISDYEDEVRELDCFDSNEMVKAFVRVAETYGTLFKNVSPYPLYNSFAWYFSEKARRLDVRAEAMLVAECRAMLTSYDDFIHGLKVNQALHEGLEKTLNSRIAKLESDYKQKVQLLLSLAVNQGVLPAMNAGLDLLESQFPLSPNEEHESLLPLLADIQQLKTGSGQEEV